MANEQMQAAVKAMKVADPEETAKVTVEEPDEDRKPWLSNRKLIALTFVGLAAGLGGLDLARNAATSVPEGKTFLAQNDYEEVTGGEWRLSDYFISLKGGMYNARTFHATKDGKNEDVVVYYAREGLTL